MLGIGGLWCVDFLALYLALFVGAAYGLVAFYLAIVNAVIHIVAGVVSREYNPGLITAAILLLPAEWWGAVACSTAYPISLQDHLVCVFFVIVVHAAIAAYLLRRRMQRWVHQCYVPLHYS